MQSVRGQCSVFFNAWLLFPNALPCLLFIFVGGKGEDDHLSSAQGGYNGGGVAQLDSTYSFYGGGGGLQNTYDPSLPDVAAVSRVFTALGGATKVNLLLTGHSHIAGFGPGAAAFVRALRGSTYRSPLTAMTEMWPSLVA